MYVELCNSSRRCTISYEVHHTGFPLRTGQDWVELRWFRRLDTQKQRPMRCGIACFAHKVHKEAWRPLQQRDGDSQA